MENQTPNTRTTPDRDTDRTLPPIQAIFAARSAAKKFGQQHHSPIRKAVGTGLPTSLSQSNRTKPKPAICRSPQAERHQEPDISTSLYPRTEQTQTPLAAAYRAIQVEAPPDQSFVASLRHPNRTNPNPSGSRISRNSGRSSSGSIFRRQPAAPEQNKPKPLRQPQIAQLRPKLLWINPSSPAYGTRTEQTQTPPAKIQAKPKSIKKRIVNHLISPAQNKPKPPSRPQKYLRKRTERSRHQSLKFALTARVSGQTTPRMFFDISESA